MNSYDFFIYEFICFINSYMNSGVPRFQMPIEYSLSLRLGVRHHPTWISCSPIIRRPSLESSKMQPDPDASSNLNFNHDSESDIIQLEFPQPIRSLHPAHHDPSWWPSIIHSGSSRTRPARGAPRRNPEQGSSYQVHGDQLDDIQWRQHSVEGFDIWSAAEKNNLTSIMWLLNPEWRCDHSHYRTMLDDFLYTAMSAFLLPTSFRNALRFGLVR